MVLDGSNLNQYLLVDKDLLEKICLFLKVFDEIIEQLSDDKRPTIHKVFPLRQRLLNECKIQDNDHIGLQKLKQFWCKLYNFILVKFSLIVVKIFNENRNINFVVNFLYR